MVSVAGPHMKARRLTGPCSSLRPCQKFCLSLMDLMVAALDRSSSRAITLQLTQSLSGTPALRSMMMASLASPATSTVSHPYCLALLLCGCLHISLLN